MHTQFRAAFVVNESFSSSDSSGSGRIIRRRRSSSLGLASRTGCRSCRTQWPRAARPQSVAHRGQGFVESGTLNSFITDRSQKASADRARACHCSDGFNSSCESQSASELLGASARRHHRRADIRGVAAEVREVIPDVLRSGLLPVLITARRIEQGEISLPGRNRGPKATGALELFLRADLHVLREHIPLGDGQGVL